MRITTEQLLMEPADERMSVAELATFTADLRWLLTGREAAFLIYPFSEAPVFEGRWSTRDIFNWNGGDEDWMVITGKEPEFMPSWLERMSGDGDLDVYVLDGVVVYVGSHA